MLAVIKTGGKQYLVKPGMKVKVEKLAGEAGSEVVFSSVFLTAEGERASVGLPEVGGASVTAKIVRHGRGSKKIVFKYHSKNRYRRKKGHRQDFTEVEVTGITG